MKVSFRKCYYFQIKTLSLLSETKRNSTLPSDWNKAGHIIILIEIKRTYFYVWFERNKLCYLRDVFYTLLKEFDISKYEFPIFISKKKMSSCFAGWFSLHLCPMRCLEHAYKVLNDMVMNVSRNPPNQKALLHLGCMVFTQNYVRMTHFM